VIKSNIEKGGAILKDNTDPRTYKIIKTQLVSFHIVLADSSLLVHDSSVITLTTPNFSLVPFLSNNAALTTTTI